MKELTTPPRMSAPYTSAGSGVGAQPTLGAATPGTTGGMPAQQGLPSTQNPLAPPLQSAEHARQFGRGEDSMLVHMTPNEVNSLRGLAQRFGGDLSTNPHTGLPEAGWLGKLLPTILGVLGAAVGIPTWAMGLGGTAVGTAVTGDLGKGLMAGLGAYGGAGLGQAVGLGGKLGSLGADLGLTGAKEAATAAATQAPMAVGQQAVTDLSKVAAQNVQSLPASLGGTGAKLAGVLPTVQGAPYAMVGDVANAAGQATRGGLGGMLDKFKQATNIPGLGNVGAIGGGLGVLSNVNEAMMPELPEYKEEEPYKYEGPYVPTARPVTMPTTSARERKGGEHMFFENSNPVPGYMPYSAAMKLAEGGPVRGRERDFGFKSLSSDIPRASAANTPASLGGKGNIRDLIARMQSGQLSQQGATPAVAPTPMQRPVAAPYTPGRERDFGFLPASQRPTTPSYGFLPPQTTGTERSYGFLPPKYGEGGEVELSDGAFVLDARTVSEVGNGSSNAGMEALRKLGGRPVQGPGDGVSDSIPARIGKDQPARVARDEVIVPADAVRRLGKGNPQRGADKLYSLMEKAHKARKRAERGQDTKLRRGLA